MKDRFLRIAKNNNAKRAAYSSVFGTGLTLLIISVSATAASAT